GLAEVERRAKGVVEEEAVGTATVYDDHHRMALVERVGPGVVLGGVVVPVDKDLAALVEGAAALASAEEVVVVVQFHPAADFVAIPRDAFARVVASDEFAVEGVKGDSAGVLLDEDAQASGDESQVAVLVIQLPGGGGGLIGNDGPGVVAAEDTALGEADADD